MGGMGGMGMGGMDWNGGGGWDANAGGMWGGNGMMDNMNAKGGYGKISGGSGKGGKGKSKGNKIVYVGEVKSFSPEKKHGYIVSERVAVEASQDVYAYQDVLQKGNAGPGDTVAFYLHWSAKGQPQASNPILRLASGDGGYALKGMVKQSDAGDSVQIHCVEVRDMLQCDVSLPAELASMLTVGQIVCFNCHVGHDGIPVAQGVEICDPEWEPLPVDLTVGRVVETRVPSCGGKGASFGGSQGTSASWGQDQWSAKGQSGWGKGDPMGDKGKGKGKVSGGGPPPTPTGRMFTGTLKSFNELNNYGFIECPEVKLEYGNDVFAHGKSLQPLGAYVGQVVYFELGVSAKGQPQAINLTAADAVEEPLAKKARTEDVGQWGEGNAEGNMENMDLTALLAGGAA